MAPPKEGSKSGGHKQGPETDNSEFRWGVKRGAGAKGKEIQFYDSFTYEGVEYSRYDCVYIHKDGESDPYIGKIIKIWDDRKDKKKKMKVMWFFRPIEIRNWVDVESTTDREIFLACGEGKGVFNINVLEVIIGKCKVLCTSKDARNPQPTEEDLNDADYFFYRFFDVGNYTVSEDFGDMEGDFIFNKHSWVNKAGPPVNQPLNGTNKVLADKFMANGDERGKTGNVILKDELNNRDVENKDMLSSLPVKEGVVTETPKEDGVLKSPKEDGMETSKGDDVPDAPRLKMEKDETPKEEVRKDETEVLKTDEIEKPEMPSKVGIEEDGAKKTAGLELGTGGKKNSEVPSKMNSKEDVTKESIRPEVGTGERKNIRRDSFREEKKPIRRARYTVDSDEEEDGVTGLKRDGLEDVSKRKIDSKKEVSGTEKKLVRKAKVEDNSVKASEGLTRTTPQLMEQNKQKISGREIIEITKKPEVESNRWFKGLPWDERLRKGYEQKAVIRLQNFDPSYTSSEIEDIMWHIFGERCTAKVIPRTAFSNLKCGEALVIFRTKEGADMAVKKLEEAFLMLSDGRPLIATKAAAPVVSGKPKFAGHISIEKHKLMHRSHQAEEIRKAVSTSHCSQPNTIEYEMAMEWRLLQEKSECWWKELYKQENLELDKVKHNHLILTANKKLDK